MLARALRPSSDTRQCSCRECVLTHSLSTAVIRAGSMSKIVNCLFKAVIFVARPRAKQNLHISQWLYVLHARQFFQRGRFPENVCDWTLLANRRIGRSVLYSGWWRCLFSFTDRRLWHCCSLFPLRGGREITKSFSNSCPLFAERFDSLLLIRCNGACPMSRPCGRGRRTMGLVCGRILAHVIGECRRGDSLAGSASHNTFLGRLLQTERDLNSYVFSNPLVLM